MKQSPDISNVLRLYLADDGAQAPDYVLDAVEQRIAAQRQRAVALPFWRSHMPRVVIYLSGIAAALFVLAIGWRLMGSSVGAGGTPSPAPTPSAPTVPTSFSVDVLSCTPEDVNAFEFRPVGGAPFQTEISLRLVGPASCTIDSPGMIIRAAGGGPALANAAPPAAGKVKLEATLVWSSELTIDSWCPETTSLPASLEVELDMTVVPVTGWSVADKAGAPACNTGTGTVFRITSWTSAPALK